MGVCGLLEGTLGVRLGGRLRGGAVSTEAPRFKWGGPRSPVPTNRDRSGRVWFFSPR